MKALGLARGAAWNLAGFLVPLLVAALYAVPGLVRALGPERFGVLALAWTVVGYFTLFDLGIGPRSRAPSRRHARTDGRRRRVNRSGPRCSDVRPRRDRRGDLIAGLAVSGRPVLKVPAGPACGNARHPRHPRRSAAVRHHERGCRRRACGLPALRRAQRRARAARRADLSRRRSRSRPGRPTSGSSARRWSSAGSRARWRTSRCARASIPAVARGPAFRREAAKPLLGFGGWMTVSAIAGPFMVYLDRFLIGALLSLAMVVLHDALRPGGAPPGAHAVDGRRALPRGRGRLQRRSGAGRAAVRLGRASISALVFPATFLLVLFAPEGMTLWLGEDFARHAAPVLRWIAAGVFLNCLGQLALSIVQASGRPRWSALLHLAELPFYLAALVVLVRARGIEGAAIAWFLRVLVDTALLFAFAARRVEGGRRAAIGWRPGSPPSRLRRWRRGRRSRLFRCAGSSRPSCSPRRRSRPGVRSGSPERAVGRASRGEVVIRPTMRSAPRPACPCAGGGARRFTSALPTACSASAARGRSRAAPRTTAGCSGSTPRRCPRTCRLAYGSYYTHAALAPRDGGPLRQVLEAAKDGHLARRFGYPAPGGRRPRARCSCRFRRGASRSSRASSTCARPGGGRVLEIGCGAGDMLAALQVLGWDAEGIDFDENAVAAARARGLSARWATSSRLRGRPKRTTRS